MKVGIVGYGNLGKACERCAVEQGDEVVGIFTRRKPCEVVSPYGTKTYAQEDVFEFKDKIDVLALCVGSKNDLIGVAKSVANEFNTVDSFDTLTQK